MKKCKAYLQLLPDTEARARALANLFPERAEDLCRDLQQALGWAFWWKHSPEGYLYWHNIHAALVGNDPLPVPEKQTI
jgi:hypothetical protein